MNPPAALHGSDLHGPPRLIRESSGPVAECPSCGAHMVLDTEGATWTIHSASDVADRLIVQMGTLEREELVVLLLNAKNVVVGQETVYVGNVSAALVKVGEVFTEAIRRCVPRVLVVHNHPSGDLTPSVDDLHLTATLIAAGRLLDVEVLDHLIVGRSGYVSLRSSGTAFDK